MTTMLIPQTCCYHGYALQPSTCMICSMVQMKLSTEMPGTSDFAFSYYPAPDLLAGPVSPYHYKTAGSSFNVNGHPVADMFMPALPKLNTAFIVGSKRSRFPIGVHDNGCESLALTPTLESSAMMLEEDHADQFALSDDEEEPQMANAIRQKYKKAGKKGKGVEVLATSDDKDHPKVKFVGRGPDKFPRKRETIGLEERKRLQELMEKIKGILSDEDPEVVLGDEEEPEVILGDEELESPRSKVQESIQLKGRTISEPQDEESNFTELEILKRHVLPRTRSRTRPSWLPPHSLAKIDPSRGRNCSKESHIEPEIEIVEKKVLSRPPKVSPRRRPSWLPPKTPTEMDPRRGRKRKQEAEDSDDEPCLRRSTRVRRVIVIDEE